MDTSRSIVKLYNLSVRIQKTKEYDKEVGTIAGGSVSARLSRNKYDEDNANIVVMIGMLRNNYVSNKYLYEYANLLWRYYSRDSIWIRMPSIQKIDECQKKIVFA